jgi:iron complex transport system ATP-binding protein
MEPLIRTEEVGFRYNHRWVIRGIDMALHRGELVGLIGPNGSGKTTLLRCLGRVLNPQAGRIFWGGRPFSAYSRRETARRIALVSQETSVVFAPSVLEAVLMGRHPYLKRFQFEGTKDLLLARKAMAWTDVAHLQGRRLTELSSGERQRVYMARALCQEPELLLLDEPTAFLDIQHQVGIMDLIYRLNAEQGLTILIASHDINLMAQYCRRILLIREGRLEGEGTPEAVIRKETIGRVFATEVLVDENPLTRTPRITLMGERERNGLRLP